MNRHEVVSLPPGFREPPRQKPIKGRQFLQPPVLTRSHFTQVSTQFNEAGVHLGFRPAQSRISSILVRTNSACLRLSLGSMGGAVGHKGHLKTSRIVVGKDWERFPNGPTVQNRRNEDREPVHRDLADLYRAPKVKQGQGDLRADDKTSVELSE